jgi:ribose transport system permease protein
MSQAHSFSLRIGRLFQAQYGLIWVLFALVAFFSVVSTTFRTPANLLEVLRASAVLSIMVLGLTWIVATGEIDLSFPEIAALSSLVTAFLIKIGWPLYAAVALAFVAGALVGVVNGYLVGFLKFPALITTIAMSSLAKASAHTLGKGQPIYIPTTKIIYTFAYGTVFGLPVLWLTALAVYLICRFIQDRTCTGQHLYALGENRKATQEAGINESRTLFYFFILSASLASIGGILMTATLSSGNPEIGGFFFLDGLTAVFLGALIIKAGKPNVLGTFIGSVILSVLVSGLTLLGAPRMASLIVKGGLLVLGIFIVTRSSPKKRIPGAIQLAK